MFQEEVVESLKSIVSKLIDVQNVLREEFDAMTTLVAQRDVEIVAMKAASVKGGEERTSSVGKLSAENAAL